MRKRQLAARMAAALSLAGMMSLAACAGVPTSGPIVHVTQSVSQQSVSGVQVAPAPPQPGAGPDAILGGFLSAMLTYAAGYPVAREYLTPQASEAWDPESGAVVYDGDGYKPQTTAASALLRAPLVGALDASGHYTASRGVAYSHDFGLVKVNGQWRISRPPSGLLISQRAFLRYYQQVSLYFIVAGGGWLAPDLVYLPTGDDGPQAALAALLQGPVSPLSSVVGSALPRGVATRAMLTIGPDGVAEVDLGSSAAALTATQLNQAVAQVAWTLTQFTPIAAVRLSAGGVPLMPAHAASDGSVTRATEAGFAPLASSGESTLYVVRKGRLVSVNADGELRPMQGAFGQQWADTARQFSLGPGLVAVVNNDRTKLYVGAIGSTKVVKALSALSLGRPQVVRAGAVWVDGVDAAGRPMFYRIDKTGEVKTVAVPAALAGSSLVAYRISPDGTRMAVVTSRAGVLQLGILIIRGGSNPTLGPWQEIGLTIGGLALTNVGDVAWAAESTLLVLASQSGDTHWAVYSASLDGAQVAQLSGADMAPDRLAAAPAASGISAAVLSSSLQLWQLRGASHWTLLTTGATDLAFG